MNLHPALPNGPVGLWQDVVWQLIASHAAESGAHTFLVTEELDRGPAIAFARVSLRGKPFDDLWPGVDPATAAHLRAARNETHPLFQAIRQAEVRREPPLVVETLRMLSGGRARIAGGAVLDCEGRAAAPRDLTAVVDAALAQP